MVGVGADGSLLGDLYAFAMTAAMADDDGDRAQASSSRPMASGLACMSDLLSALVAAPFAA